MSSHRKRLPRKVSAKKINDVFHNPRKKTLKLHARRINIELTAKAWHPVYIRYRGGILSALAFVLIIGTFGVYRLTTHANVAVLYPTSCLGGWTNVHAAEGKPDVGGTDSTAIFDENNSAVLPANTLAEIYCGTFVGNISEDSQPKKISLHFSWDFAQAQQASSTGDSLQVATSTVGSLASSSTSTFASSSLSADLSGSSSEVIVAPIDSPIPAAAPTVVPLAPDATSTPDTSTIQSYLFDFFIKKALAQTREGSTTPTASTTDASTSDIVSTTTSITTPVQTTPSGFLEIDYTLDGVTWNVLGMVDQAHLHSATFEIPIATTIAPTTASSTDAATSSMSDTAANPSHLAWRDMSNIQIKIKSMSSIDPVPPLYLDGMSLVVTYGDEDLNFKTQSGLYIGHVQTATSTGSSMKLDVRNDGSVQELIISSGAALGGLAIYDASSSAQIMTTYVGDSRYSITPEYFGVGTYDIILTTDPNNCSNQSLDECRRTSGTQGEGTFDVVTENSGI